VATSVSCSRMASSSVISLISSSAIAGPFKNRTDIIIRGNIYWLGIGKF